MNSKSISRIMNAPQSSDFSAIVAMICKEDSRYADKAYHFTRQALGYTLKQAQSKKHFDGAIHISGRTLLQGIREFALDQFGPMTMTVFNDWGIHQCEDFGDIVFNLVDYGVLGKSPHDVKEDFKGIYSFRQAFIKPFEPKRSRTHSSKKSSEKNGEQ